MFFIDKKKWKRSFFQWQPVDKLISGFDLRNMEKKLEANIWVKDAELFFDNRGQLQIRVSEREPIARVFTVGKNSFYIDSSGERLPVAENPAAHLMVFTNFPVEKGRLKNQESILMREMVTISEFINKSEFWSAQVEQIDITPNRTFEMAPLIGNHIVVLGDGDNLQEKFDRLFVFYKDVMSRTGFDHYVKLDVQYKDQVVATRKASAFSKQDSLLAVQKVKQMIAEAQQIEPDTLMQRKVRPIEKSDISEQNLANYDLLPVNADTALPETPKNPDPLKTIIGKESHKNTVAKPVKKPEKKNEAKGVMEKRGF
jgi:cell division protein FtsQ